MAEDQTDNGPASTTADHSVEIDTTVAHPARVYAYWLGGKDNFAADREAAERVLAATPGLRFRIQANRAFLARVVRYLAARAGIRQFRAPPSTSTATCGTARPFCGRAARTLDFTQPIALLLLGILHLIQDSEQPYQIVADLMDALPSGSYLAISHPAIDSHAAQAEAQKRYNERMSTPQTQRTHAEVARFFDGLELVPPGVVYVHTWRPDPGDTAPPDAVSAHGGVAPKP